MFKDDDMYDLMGFGNESEENSKFHPKYFGIEQVNMDLKIILSEKVC